MRTRLRVLVLITVAAVGLAGCFGALDSGEKLPRLVGNRRVLFIGNSHTTVNFLPEVVLLLARNGGDTALRVASISVPGYTLEDHFLNGRATRTLAHADWEFVVMQQGTSAQPTSQAHLDHWAGVFAPLIRDAGAEPVLYQIWPLAIERYNADAALTAYHNAAVTAEGLLAPAGDAFTAALDSNPAISVYAEDGLHATPLGTYLAALVILERISGIQPESLPAVVPGTSVDATVARELQAAAALALSRNPARPTVPRP